MNKIIDEPSIVFDDIDASKIDLCRIFLDVGKMNTLLSAEELLTLYSLSKKCQTTNGDYAEAGVYSGASAYIIAVTKGNKTLHLFDTFKGLPFKDDLFKSSKGEIAREGSYSSSLENVKNNLNKFRLINYYDGLFMDTFLRDIKVKSSILNDKNRPEETETQTNAYDKTFAFVHIDADLYISTLESLSFFYPRLNKDGLMLVHDRDQESVKRAINIYFNNKIIKHIIGTEYFLIDKKED